MNILKLIQDQLSPQTLNQISVAVGETPEATKSALGTAVPALLGSLVGEAWSSKCGTDLFNQISQAKPPGGWPDSASGLLSAFGGGTSPQPAGPSLVTTLLGLRANSVAGFIANRCGIKTGSAMSILGMAAPLVMGTLGKLISSQGLGASAFGDLLRSQVSHLQGLIPDELANVLGIGKLAGSAADAPSLKAPATDSPWQAARSRLSGELPEHAGIPAGAARTAGILRWVWIPVVILLGGWLILNRNHQAAPAMGGAADQTYSAVQNAGQNTVASLRSLNLTPGGAADRLAKTLASGGSATPVELQGLNFDETGNLTETAQANLREMGSVLQASPRLRITVTAYGKTSDEGLARADAIKTALIARGVSADRVAAKGDSGEGAPVISFSK